MSPDLYSPSSPSPRKIGKPNTLDNAACMSQKNRKVSYNIKEPAQALQTCPTLSNIGVRAKNNERTEGNARVVSFLFCYPRRHTLESTNSRKLCSLFMLEDLRCTADPQTSKNLGCCRFRFLAKKKGSTATQTSQKKSFRGAPLVEWTKFFHFVRDCILISVKEGAMKYPRWRQMKSRSLYLVFLSCEMLMTPFYCLPCDVMCD